MPKAISREIELYGIAASPGICIGKAYLVGKEGVDVVEKYFISKDHLQDEIKRFKTAVKKAKDELQSIIKQIPEELSQHAYILETHMVLFKDKMLYGRTIEIIENELLNAEWALKMVLADVKSMFGNMADSYLKGRAADIIHVSDSIMRNLVGAETENIASIYKRVILVASDHSQLHRQVVRHLTVGVPHVHRQCVPFLHGRTAALLAHVFVPVNVSVLEHPGESVAFRVQQQAARGVETRRAEGLDGARAIARARPVAEKSRETRPLGHADVDGHGRRSQRRHDVEGAGEAR